VATITEERKEEVSPARAAEMRTAVCRFLLRFDEQLDRLIGKPYSVAPYWAFLLELYLAEAEGKPTFQSCLSAGEASSNAHRRSARLAEMGVIRREADPTDHRRMNLRLTLMMKRALDKVFDTTFGPDVANADVDPASIEPRFGSSMMPRFTSSWIPHMGVVRGKVKSGGRIALPADIRHSLGLQNGDTVLFELEGDEVRLRSARTALRRVQKRLRSFAPADRLVSDELIAEQRIEALRA